MNVCHIGIDGIRTLDIRFETGNITPSPILLYYIDALFIIYTLSYFVGVFLGTLLKIAVQC